MSTPINLNKARKAAKRTAAKVRADENVVKHGLSKEVRAHNRARVARSDKMLDGHKREQ